MNMEDLFRKAITAVMDAVSVDRLAEAAVALRDAESYALRHEHL